MIQKKFSEIQLEDLQQLITNQISENKTLEYKSILKVDKDADKKEFLYDVSSFANANGGDLIFGMAEGDEKGVPISLDGLEDNMDELCRKIENLIRDCISPRLLNIEIKTIPLAQGRNLLLIRLGKSSNAPHQVTFQNVDRFYSRSNNGKYILDVFELRNAFLQSASFNEKVKTFIKERIDKITLNETPVPIDNSSKIVVHIVPLESMQQGGNIVTVPELKQDIFSPLGGGSYNSRINLDGVVNYCSLPGQQVNNAYIQLYKTGIIETVSTGLLKLGATRKAIYVDKDFSVEEKIITFISDALVYMQKLNIQPPLYLFLHFINVKGFEISSSRLHQSILGQKAIQTENIFLPEIVLQSYPDNVGWLIKEWFDAIWNASGYERCRSYDANGNFTGF